VKYATPPKYGWGGRRPGAGRKPVPREQLLRKHTVYLTETEWEACTCNAALGVKPEEYIRHLVQYARTVRERRNDGDKDTYGQPNTERGFEL